MLFHTHTHRHGWETRSVPFSQTVGLWVELCGDFPKLGENLVYDVLELLQTFWAHLRNVVHDHHRVNAIGLLRLLPQDVLEELWGPEERQKTTIGTRNIWFDLICTNSKSVHIGHILKSVGEQFLARHKLFYLFFQLPYLNQFIIFILHKSKMADPKIMDGWMWWIVVAAYLLSSELDKWNWRELFVKIVSKNLKVKCILQLFQHLLLLHPSETVYFPPPSYQSRPANRDRTSVSTQVKIYLSPPGLHIKPQTTLW